MIYDDEIYETYDAEETVTFIGRSDDLEDFLKIIEAIANNYGVKVK